MNDGASAHDNCLHDVVDRDSGNSSIKEVLLEGEVPNDTCVIETKHYQGLYISFTSAL